MRKENCTAAILAAQYPGGPWVQWMPRQSAYSEWSLSAPDRSDRPFPHMWFGMSLSALDCFDYMFMLVKGDRMPMIPWIPTQYHGGVDIIRLALYTTPALVNSPSGCASCRVGPHSSKRLEEGDATQCSVNSGLVCVVGFLHDVVWWFLPLFLLATKYIVQSIPLERTILVAGICTFLLGQTLHGCPGNKCCECPAFGQLVQRLEQHSWGVINSAAAFLFAALWGMIFHGIKLKGGQRNFDPLIRLGRRSCGKHGCLLLAFLVLSPRCADAAVVVRGGKATETQGLLCKHDRGGGLTMAQHLTAQFGQTGRPPESQCSAGRHEGPLCRDGHSADENGLPVFQKRPDDVLQAEADMLQRETEVVRLLEHHEATVDFMVGPNAPALIAIQVLRIFRTPLYAAITLEPTDNVHDIRNKVIETLKTDLTGHLECVVPQPEGQFVTFVECQKRASEATTIVVDGRQVGRSLYAVPASELFTTAHDILGDYCDLFREEDLCVLTGGSDRRSQSGDPLLVSQGLLFAVVAQGLFAWEPTFYERLRSYATWGADVHDLPAGPLALEQPDDAQRYSLVLFQGGEALIPWSHLDSAQAFKRSVAACIGERPEDIELCAPRGEIDEHSHLGVETAFICGAHLRVQRDRYWVFVDARDLGSQVRFCDFDKKHITAGVFLRATQFTELPNWTSVLKADGRWLLADSALSLANHAIYATANVENDHVADVIGGSPSSGTLDLNESDGSDDDKGGHEQGRDRSRTPQRDGSSPGPQDTEHTLDSGQPSDQLATVIEGISASQRERAWKKCFDSLDALRGGFSQRSQSSTSRIITLADKVGPAEFQLDSMTWQLVEDPHALARLREPWSDAWWLVDWETLSPLHPATVQELAKCKPLEQMFQDQTCGQHLVIYTDGSYSDEQRCGWAAILLVRKSIGESFALLGVIGGSVTADTTHPLYVGADACGSSQAERTAMLWAALWILQLPWSSCFQEIVFKFDNCSAGFAAEGIWHLGDDDLSQNMRSVFLLLHSCLPNTPLRHEHVKSHDGNGWNEFADVAAKKAAQASKGIAGPPAAAAAILRQRGVKWLWAMASTAVSQQFPLSNNGAFSWKEDMGYQQSDLVPDHLIRTTPGTASRTTQRCIHTKIYAANVQGLQGKHRFIEEQLCKMSCNIALIQEGKGHSGVVISERFLRISSESKGVWGAEIWISRVHGLGTCQDIPFFIDKNDLRVVLESPRILALHIAIAQGDFLLIAAHCPHWQRPSEEKDAFFHDLQGVLEKFEQRGPIIIGIDLNGRMPAEIGQATGRIEPDLPDEQGIKFALWLEERDMIAPSTFIRYHSGSDATWTHTSGSTARLDYICIGGPWLSGALKSWVAADIDLANKQDDHSAIALEVTWTITSGPVQRTVRRLKLERDKLLSSDGRKLLQQELEHFKPTPWEVHPDAHCRDIEERLRQILRDHFAAPANGPKASYISEEAWNIRQARVRLKRRTALSARERAWLLVQAALQHWTGQGDDLWAWSKKRNLLYDLFAGALNFSGARLREKLRADKNAFLQSLASGYGALSGSSLISALKKAGIGRRVKARVVQPLPTIRGQDSESTRRKELDSLWMKHFGQQEMGEILTVADFLEQQRQYRPDLSELVWEPDLLPSLHDIEELCRGVAANKAVGLDGIPGELFRAAPAQMARIYQPLFIKAVIAVQQPLQWAGGTLFEAHKGIGDPADLDSFRSLFVASVPGKLYHKFLRSKIGDLITDTVTPLHFGARRGAPVAFPALVTMLFGRWAKTNNFSHAFLFLDTRAAYYRVLRQTVIGQIGTLEDTVGLFRRFGLGPNDLQQLLRTVDKGGLFHEHGMSAHLRMLVRDLYARTWFITPYADGQKLCQTHAGSRPGESWADIVFTFIFAKVNNNIRQRLAALDLLQTVPYSGDPMLWCDGDATEQAEFLAAIWADDAVYPIADQDPTKMVRRLQATAAVVLDACEAHGLEPNLKAGKTSIVMKLRGKGSLAAAKAFFRDKDSMLVCDRADGRQTRIPIVASYKHLGGMLDAAMTGVQEAKRRSAIAKAAFDSRARQLFHNVHIPLEVRCALFPGTILPTYFNLALWSGAEKAWGYLAAAFSRLVRRMLWRSCDRASFFTIPAAMAHELTGILPLHIYAAMRRISLLQSMVNINADIGWAMAQSEGQWRKAVENDFKLLLPAADAKWPMFTPVTWPQWWHILREQSGAVKGAVRRNSQKLFSEYLSVEAQRLLLGGLFREAERAAGGRTEAYEWVCGPCAKMFASKAALATHFFGKHGRKAVYRSVASGSFCAGCGKEFHNFCRLLFHLRGKPTCVRALQQAGYEVKSLEPGICSKAWRKRSLDDFHIAPPQPLAAPLPPAAANFGGASAVVDDAYFAICVQLLSADESDTEGDGHDFLLQLLAQHPLYPEECISIVQGILLEVEQQLATGPVPWSPEVQRWVCEAMKNFRQQFHGLPFHEGGEDRIAQLQDFSFEADWERLLRKLCECCPTQGTPNSIPCLYKLDSSWEAGFKLPSGVFAVPALGSLTPAAASVKSAWRAIVQGKPCRLQAPPDFARSQLARPFLAAAAAGRASLHIN